MIGVDALIISGFVFLTVYPYLKTVIIMAKFDLKFICDHDSRESDFIKARLEKVDNDYPIDTILITACMYGQ